ncbi:type I restriction enzyme, S subunit [Lachnospiraceae bacterium KHCPX20]|nr:type I restriction enzyme, S subunit [Lachnospiraceae bacterium KHCPX20]
MSKVLSDCAYYITEKIDCTLLSDKTYIGMDNMLPDKGGITESEYTPSEGTATRFKKGDILIGNIRPYFKKIWYATFDGGCSPDVLCIRGNGKLSSDFLYALLSQDAFFDYDMAGSKGSKMPRGDKNHIMNYPVPELKGYDEIGKIIVNINDKIINNTRINREISTVVKMLYDYWFLQFDFPDEEGKPYKESGGRLEWNEELNMDIPMGWECKTIDDISKRVKVGFVGPIDKYYCEKEVGFPIIRPAEMSVDGIDYSSLNYITKEFYEKNVKSQIHKGDILISRCGKDGIPNIYELDTKAQVLNAVIIEPDNDLADSIFINETLKSDLAQKQIQNGTSGSVQGVINTAMIASIKLPFEEGMCKNFVSKVKPLVDTIIHNREENRELISLRNFILPLMMNGQIYLK